MRPHIGADACIVASGAALEQNAHWRQMLADATGLRVILEGHTESTSRGVAILARRAFFQEKRNLRAEAKPSTDAIVSAPSAQYTPLWMRELEFQEHLYNAMNSRGSLVGPRKGRSSTGAKHSPAEMNCWLAVGSFLAGLTLGGLLRARPPR